jgi:hypothetical protein
MYDFHAVKYAYDLGLLAKEEGVLHGMIDRLMEIGRQYGTEMDVEKTKVMRNLEVTIPSTSFARSKAAEECGMFQLYGYYD